jgi:hypothetical protein
MPGQPQLLRAPKLGHATDQPYVALPCSARFDAWSSTRYLNPHVGIEECFSDSQHRSQLNFPWTRACVSTVDYSAVRCTWTEDGHAQVRSCTRLIEGCASRCGSASVSACEACRQHACQETRNNPCKTLPKTSRCVGGLAGYLTAKRCTESSEAAASARSSSSTAGDRAVIAIQ